MSKPIQPPTDPTGFVEALRTYNLAAAEWLGLDPGQVYRMDVTEPAPSSDSYSPPSLVTVRWTATERQTPKVGYREWGTHYDLDGVSHSGRITLNAPDGEAFMAAIGPKPRQFTREQELILKGLAAER